MFNSVPWFVVKDVKVPTIYPTFKLHHSWPPGRIENRKLCSVDEYQLRLAYTFRGVLSASDVVRPV